jgi:tryptophan-rich sensory protein
MPDTTSAWYQQLSKPSWAPPSWLFGPVWTVLYAGVAVTFGTVFVYAAKGKIPAIVALPFALNLAFNFAFTPLQFGLRSNVFASVDILLVLGTLLWAIAAVRPFVPWIAWAQIPYLLWVAFATVLQLTVTWLNR